MAKTRNESLDMITGIMILWMMVYHVFQWAGITDSMLYKTALQWLFFFIPWFYFKSGMFFKPVQNDSIVGYIKKRINSIGIPLLVWFAIGYLIQCPELLIVNNKPLWKIATSPLYHFLRSGDTPGNNPLWFLVSFFFVQILSFYIVRIKYYFIIILFLLPAGLFLGMYSVILPLSASTIPLGLFFYFAGFFYSKYCIKYDLKYFIMAVTPLFIISNILFSSYVDIHLNMLMYGNYLSFILMSFLAIIISIYFSKFFYFNFLAWVGKKSMYLLVLHWPIFYVTKISFYFIKGYSFGYDFALALIIIAFPACMMAIKTLGSKKLLFGK